MPALRADLSATSLTLVTSADTEIGSLWKLDSEAIRCMGTYKPFTNPGTAPATDWYWIVQRARGGTTAATHSSGATLTEFFPESGSTAAASGSIPAGIIAMWGGLVADIPSGWLLCNGANGTPDLRDRFVKGASAEAGSTGGAATHGHSVTQPSDHAALTHSGATVGNHAFTQPSAHSFTQPAGHAAHVFTQPTGHSNHVVTQPAAHADNIAHTHVLSMQGGTTAATTGTHIMNSTATGGSVRAITAGDVVASQGTGASLTHSATAVDAHSAHSGGGVDAHSAHSGGAVDAHAGGAVDAHSVGQASQHAAQAHSGAAVNTVNNEPAYYALCFIQKS